MSGVIPKVRPFLSTNGSGSVQSTFYLLPHNRSNNSCELHIIKCSHLTVKDVETEKLSNLSKGTS